MKNPPAFDSMIQNMFYQIFILCFDTFKDDQWLDAFNNVRRERSES